MSLGSKRTGCTSDPPHLSRVVGGKTGSASEESEIDWPDENCKKGEPGMKSDAQTTSADVGNRNDPPKVFITGNSSGLGRGLSDASLDRGWEVYGVSRRGAGLKHARLRDRPAGG